MYKAHQHNGPGQFSTRPNGLGTDLPRLMQLYYAGVAADELNSRSQAELQAITEHHWRLAQQLHLTDDQGGDLGAPLALDIFCPKRASHGWDSHHHALQLVCADMPFLIDSVKTVLAQHDCQIQLLVHPILSLAPLTNGVEPGSSLSLSQDDHGEGMARSFIHIEFSPASTSFDITPLHQAIQAVMTAVAVAVGDWSAMRVQAYARRVAMDASPPPIPVAEINEAHAFLEWLEQDHFTFLGYQEQAVVSSESGDKIDVVPGSGLGILSDNFNGPDTEQYLGPSEEIERFARSKRLLVITQSSLIATVHRPDYMDVIAVNRFDRNGRVVGAHIFLGLLTNATQSMSARAIPILRHKITHVLDQARLPATSHAGKSLIQLLETYPRNELLQVSEQELFNTAMGVLNLQERPQIKVFVRRDRYGRYFSCLVYVPASQYSDAVLQRIQAVLKEAFTGRDITHQVWMAESNLVRVYCRVSVAPGQAQRHEPEQIESQIAAAARTWDDQLLEQLIEQVGNEKAEVLHRRYCQGLPSNYREEHTPELAIQDIELLEQLRDGRPLAIQLHAVNDTRLRCKLVLPQRSMALSDALPLLQNMGLKVISEHPFALLTADGLYRSIQEFDVELPAPIASPDQRQQQLFIEAFERVFSGQLDNDPLNALVLYAHLHWREAELLRALSHYLQQLNPPYGQSFVEQTLLTQPQLAQQLVQLFALRFDGTVDPAQRQARQFDLSRQIEVSLEQIESWDADRVLRNLLQLIQATVRSNFYALDKQGLSLPRLAFKFEPEAIELAPAPKPKHEIFVFSADMEGVHLRCGPIARGGIRWSDRQQDYRTEILGLVKAQHSKNAVIVPAGAKGGFICKRIPQGAHREAQLTYGLSCYREFIRGLLDLTDNRINGETVSAEHLVCYDGPDSYLVVAPDKGTASFSDTANAIAEEYDFWIGDAFASGGSRGYDHKKMGITARGAWESVKHHFGRLGINVQQQAVSAIGIGDMSGDVFGNGMLLSPHVQLLAAFDHRHIFIDPEPPGETAFKERERLFALPRSSWANYNPDLISAGGGVYSRNSKHVTVSETIRGWLKLPANRLSPDELIHALLQADVDLLWNGGIGTYVRSLQQRNADCQDRANDAIRVAASALRCKVIGEGGNLGFTQAGRIEFSQRDGHVNNDSVDNSAGVDCSDHEVNLKIWLDLQVSRGQLTMPQRNRLLGRIDQDVARQVLSHNRRQNQALSIAQSKVVERIDEYRNLLRQLEDKVQLERELEVLPDDEQLQQRSREGRGLSRPELAVISAYSKISLKQDLLAQSDLLITQFDQELANYFPEPVRTLAPITEHPLAAQIAANCLANEMGDRLGAAFPHRVQQETGINALALANAYVTARDTVQFAKLWAELDQAQPEQLNDYLAIHAQVQRTLRQLVRSLISRQQQQGWQRNAVARYRDAASQLQGNFAELLGDTDQQRCQQHSQQLTELGLTIATADQIAALPYLETLFDVIDISLNCGCDVRDAAKLYAQVGQQLQLGWLRGAIADLQASDQWQALARLRLRNDSYRYQANITNVIVSLPDPTNTAQQRVDNWLAQRIEAVAHFRQLLSSLQQQERSDYAALSVLCSDLQALANQQH